MKLVLGNGWRCTANLLAAPVPDDYLIPPEPTKNHTNWIDYYWVFTPTPALLL